MSRPRAWFAWVAVTTASVAVGGGTAKNEQVRGDDDKIGDSAKPLCSDVSRCSSGDKSDKLTQMEAFDLISSVYRVTMLGWRWRTAPPGVDVLR